MEVISKIVAALRQAKLPATYGFVNARWTESEPDKIAVLRAWRDAGDPLGNHTWSHMNLDANPLDAFESDVARNEPLISELMKNEDWHWFRFPFLVEGYTPEKRNGIRAYLGKHGYKIAGVTMSFSDYLWNEPYARCKAKGDQKSIRVLEKSYLRAAKDSANYSRAMSNQLFHRDIPYVLLMHVGAFDAEMLPRLLGVYRKQGFQFVALREAERDEFYKNDVNLELPASADTLEQAMAERGLAPPARPSPTPKPEAVCRASGS